MRMKVTIIGYYDVDPSEANEAYRTTDPVEMAKIDEGALREDTGMFLSIVSLEDSQMTVEPVTED